MPPLLVHGGRIIDPASGLDATGDVLVDGGSIVAIETAPRRLEQANVDRLDAEGLIVAPGLIDPHVHFREPSQDHEETIASGVAAALSGGFTAVVCMPNTRPPLDSPDLIRFVERTGADLAATRVYAAGCATAGRRGEAVADLEAMAQAGAVGFTDDGAVIAEAAIMREVLERAARLGRCVMQHCQEPSLTRGASMNAGPLARRLGLVGWPALAEELIIERDLRLNRDVGCRYHAQHLSSAGSVDLIRAARAEGRPVSGEVTPHHLLLTEAACEELGTLAKMNPPLRTAADREALKRGVADGTITVLATDHAPHPARTKAVEFARASFGVVGLDCALALFATALVEDGVIGWPAMLAMMTVNPAALTGLDRQGLGSLTRGGPADLTLIDPQARWTIDPAAFAGTGRNCPFAGRAVGARAAGVVVGGRPRMLRASQRLSPAPQSPLEHVR